MTPEKQAKRDHYLTLLSQREPAEVFCLLDGGDKAGMKRVARSLTKAMLKFVDDPSNANKARLGVWVVKADKYALSDTDSRDCFLTAYEALAGKDCSYDSELFWELEELGKQELKKRAEKQAGIPA